MKTVSQAIKKEMTMAGIGNAVLGAIGTYLALPKEDILPLLGGPESAGFALLPPSIGFPLVATLMTTAMVKKSVAKGELDVSTGTPIGWLPKNTFITAVLLTLFSIVVLMPISLGAIWLGFGDSLSFTTSMVVTVIYLIALALILMPIVVRRAIQL